MATNVLESNSTLIEQNWLEPNFQNIPIAIQKLPWAVWKAEPKVDRSGNLTGKWNKAPRSPKTGLNIGTNQPDKFGTLQEAQKAYATGKYTGVGVLLNKNNITGIDIDNAIESLKCINGLNDWMRQAIKEKVYCEYSPSQSGLRLFVYGTLNSNGRKRGSLEIYDECRFLTVTGKPVNEKKLSEFGGELVYGQHLIESFLRLMPNESLCTIKSTFSSNLTGKLSPGDISEIIKSKLPDIFNRAELIGDKYERLFNGDISFNHDDHSAADLSLISYLSRHGLSPKEADQVFRSSGLYRPKWDELRGSQTYGEMTINKVFGSTNHESNGKDPQSSHGILSPLQFQFSSPDDYKPIYIPNGMPPRKFIGPKISEGTRLFPEKALSSLVALGAVGKTSLLLSIGCHIAAGKNWNGHPLQQKKVAIFFCEEVQDEISRKFSAITDGWDDEERQKAISNLITIPLLGIDARLTAIDRGQYKSSGMTEEIIALIRKFDLKDGPVILDHMQGFTSGDLNISETATALCREANKIVEATGAAVVMAAHISKANINAKEIEQGFAVGSLAFENATRQMAGMISMPIEDAKKYGLEDKRKEYVRLALAKNSYGAADNGLWLKKVISTKYHTAIFVPVVLTKPIGLASLSEIQKVAVSLEDYINKHPNTTRNKLDALSGTRSIFKVSKAKVRQALDNLIASGQVRPYKIDENLRKSLGLAKQVKEVLRINEAMAANTSTEVSSSNPSPADFNPNAEWD